MRKLCDRRGTEVSAADDTICLERLTFREFGLTPPHQEPLLTSERDRHLSVNSQPFVQESNV